eukprot:1860229-Prymnesium_polylepis.1
MQAGSLSHTHAPLRRYSADSRTVELCERLHRACSEANKCPPWLPTWPEDMERRLTRACERRDDDKVECGEGAPSRGPLRKVLAQFLCLRNPRRREPSIPEIVLTGGHVSALEAVIVARFLCRHVVTALGVPDEVNLLCPLRKKEREPGVGRAQVVPATVAVRRINRGSELARALKVRRTGSRRRASQSTYLAVV